MRCGRKPRIADISDQLTPLDLLASADFEAREMRIPGFIAISMIDDNFIAVTPSRNVGFFHYSISSSVNVCAARSGEINSLMQFWNLINRMYPVTKSGRNAIELLVLNRLNGRCVGKQFFLILYQFTHLII